VAIALVVQAANLLNMTAVGTLKLSPRGVAISEMYEIESAGMPYTCNNSAKRVGSGHVASP
jgi:hypothetical protein